MDIQGNVCKMRDGIGLLEVYTHTSLDASLLAVNTARNSFNKRKKTYDPTTDKRLLDFLASHTHTSPFRHYYVTFYVHAPEFVARQWWKHIVGSEYAFKDTGWNELSLRYSPGLFIFEPDKFYIQSKDKKQGRSKEVHHRSLEYRKRYAALIEQIQELYSDMVSSGVSMEQARIILPLGVYTSFYWTASLQAIQHFVKLRSKDDAQAEIREYAYAMAELMKPLAGDAWDSLETYT
jgi:thymidylate synthase (FAD)